MIIENFKVINKGAVKAHFDLKITKWGNFIIHGMVLFEKNGHKWINFPSFSIADKETGKMKYLSHCHFESRETNDAFSEKLMPLIQEELRKT